MNTNRHVTLKHLFIDNKRFIGLKFQSDKILNNLIKELPSISWSNEFHMYCVINNKENLCTIFNLFRGVAWINTNYFLEKSNSKNLNEKIDISWFKKREKTEKYKYCPDSYLNKLELKKYANNTIKTYVTCFEKFINHFS